MNRQHEPVRLKDAVADHQVSQTLDADQLNILLGMQAETKGAVPAAAYPSRPSQFGMTAFLGAIAGLLLALWLGTMPSSPLPDQMLARIADEVAMNHLKLRPMEVRSSDLNALRRYFTELDFRPVQIAMLSGSEGRVLGGRYCSIQGKTAAQFRVQNLDGALRTVYEVRYDPRVHGTIPDVGKGEAPVQVMARGVPVKVWVESGLLFAVTGEG